MPPAHTPAHRPPTTPGAEDPGLALHMLIHGAGQTRCLTDRDSGLEEEVPGGVRELGPDPALWVQTLLLGSSEQRPQAPPGCSGAMQGAGPRVPSTLHVSPPGRVFARRSLEPPGHLATPGTQSAPSQALIRSGSPA